MRPIHSVVRESVPGHAASSPFFGSEIAEWSGASRCRTSTIAFVVVIPEALMPIPRGLLVDLDGTLVDNSGVASAVRHTCEVLSDRHGFDPDMLGAANGAVFGSYFPTAETDWALGRLSGVAVEVETWRRTLQRVGCDDDQIVRFAAETFSEANRNAIRIYDDALTMLRALPVSVQVCVVTNGAADSQRQKLRAIGVADRLDAVVISAEIGIAKPDPGIFLEALRRLGLDSSLAWHVGDSLATDVAGANAAGLTSIWLNRSGQSPSGQLEATFEVHTLDLVPRLWSDQR